MTTAWPPRARLWASPCSPPPDGKRARDAGVLGPVQLGRCGIAVPEGQDLRWAIELPSDPAGGKVLADAAKAALGVARSYATDLETLLKAAPEDDHDPQLITELDAASPVSPDAPCD